MTGRTASGLPTRRARTAAPTQHVLLSYSMICVCQGKASSCSFSRAVFPSLFLLHPCVREDGFWATRVVRKDGGTTSPAALQGVHVTLRSMTTDFQPLGTEEDDTEGGT